MVFFDQAEQHVDRRPRESTGQLPALFQPPRGRGQGLVGIPVPEGDQNVEKLVNRNQQIANSPLYTGHASTGNSDAMSS